MTDYKSYAPCGFCKHYGSVFTAYKEDVCRDCEVRRIRSALETLENAALWEHDHKYRADSDSVVRNCAHCKHALAINDRYHSAQYGDDISCRFDKNRLGEHGTYPVRPALSECDRWERAADLSLGDSAYDDA